MRTTDQVDAMLAFWQEALAMGSWEIDWYIESGDPGWSAKAHVQDNYDRGSIAVHPRAMGITLGDSQAVNFDYDLSTNDEKFEKIIVHELLHLLFRRRDRAHKRIADQVPEEAKSAFLVLADDADEEIVEQVARTMVKLRRGILSI